MISNTQDFLSIKTFDDLSRFLNTSIKCLNLFCRVNTPSCAYQYFKIRKKTGGERTICAPTKTLKCFQKKLSAVLYDLYQPREATQGYVKHKSIVTNARVHQGNRLVLNIDLKDFFDTITYGRVVGLFINQPFNFNKTVAHALAQLVCCNRKLPQGAPTSPIISNFICRRLDNELYSLARQYKLVYTRYCDDITISTKARSFPSSVFKYNEEGAPLVGSKLESIIVGHDFHINYEKLRCQNKSQRQMVTGLVVNVKPNILRAEYKKFRAIVHYTYWNGINASATRNGFKTGNDLVYHLRGRINFYKMVWGLNNSRYQWLASKYNEIIGKAEFFVPEPFESTIYNNLFVIENNSSQGTAFLLRNIGLVTCLHNICNHYGSATMQDIKKELEHCFAYLPSNKRIKFTAELNKLYQEKDLIVLSILPFPHQNQGFNMARIPCSFKLGQKEFIALGYPNHSDSSGVYELFDFAITQKRVELGLELLIIDKPLYAGSSGGPVLNLNHEVVGYIEKGNELGKDGACYSAFCPIDILKEHTSDTD